MTRREITRIVRGWQKRLRLTNYSLSISFIPNDPNVADLEGGHAEIKVHDDYESAHLKIAAGFAGWNERFANEVIVHELLHIFENGTGTAVESLEEVLDNDAYKLILARYSSAAENMVDRLALILVALAGVVPLSDARAAKPADG